MPGLSTITIPSYGSKAKSYKKMYPLWMSVIIIIIIINAVDRLDSKNKKN